MRDEIVKRRFEREANLICRVARRDDVHHVDEARPLLELRLRAAEQSEARLHLVLIKRAELVVDQQREILNRIGHGARVDPWNRVRDVDDFERKLRLVDDRFWRVCSRKRDVRVQRDRAARNFPKDSLRRFEHGVGVNVADRAYFQSALHTHDFTLSDYLISRVYQLPGLIATYPVLKDDGSIDGVVLASINLQWMGDLAATAARRADTSVDLIDGSGTLLAASADQGALIGKDFAAPPLVRDMLANDEGTMTTVGFDGVRRIFAYIRLPWTRARLAVGLDEAVVHGSIDREISIAYLQLALFGILVLLAAWFGGERLILRPIRSLVRMATRLGRGDLQVRAADEPWLAEFEPLAAAFDDMARKLAGREEELQIANQHLEELASLDGLTGLANRRGFDRELEREWQRAAERSQPLALMMIDIDHFKLFNDRYGHVRGDACLRAVGETLSLVTLEEAVLVARYGGEEFALLLPGLDIARTTALAEEARRAIEDLLIVHDEASSGFVTISIGVESQVPEPGQSAADLVEAADRAIYAAKRRGRNTVVAQVPLLLSAAS